MERKRKTETCPAFFNNTYTCTSHAHHIYIPARCPSFYPSTVFRDQTAVCSFISMHRNAPRLRARLLSRIVTRSFFFLALSSTPVATALLPASFTRNSFSNYPKAYATSQIVQFLVMFQQQLMIFLFFFFFSLSLFSFFSSSREANSIHLLILYFFQSYLSEVELLQYALVINVIKYCVAYFAKRYPVEHWQLYIGLYARLGFHSGWGHEALNKEESRAEENKM